MKLIKNRNREEYLRTFKPNEKELIKDTLEKAFKKKGKRKRGDLWYLLIRLSTQKLIFHPT